MMNDEYVQCHIPRLLCLWVLGTAMLSFQRKYVDNEWDNFLYLLCKYKKILKVCVC